MTSTPRDWDYDTKCAGCDKLICIYCMAYEITTYGKNGNTEFYCKGCEADAKK
jgi:hypothetical protein